jgi:stage II sporulation protein D
LQELEEALRKGGYPIDAVATLSPIRWSKAGRLLTVRILHAGGELILRADDLRKAIGYQRLPSVHFRIDSFGKEIQFSGMGFGHGVGLCQWGAKVMAERGLKFDEILLYYYPGVHLTSYEEIK